MAIIRNYSTSEMGITVGGKNLEDSIVNGQNANIKGATSKIKDEDILLAAFLVKTVSNGSSSGFIDNSSHVETSNNAGVLRRLSLGIVEVGWKRSKIKNNNLILNLKFEIWVNFLYQGR